MVCWYAKVVYGAVLILHGSDDLPTADGQNLGFGLFLVDYDFGSVLSSLLRYSLAKVSG